MTTRTKNAQRFLLVISCLLAVVIFAGCSAKPSADNGNAITENSVAGATSELIVAGNEIAIGVDPTVYPAADYLLNMGAGEILFKADANAVIQPYFAKAVSQLDEYTWEIKLHPNATFWSGDPADAKAVIASLMRSKELDPKANPFLQGIDFTAVDSDTIRAVTETPNMDITLNLSSPQLLIHNTAEKYTYESIETADYTGMYRIVEFEPAQRMVFEKNENYWGTKPEIQRVVHEQIGDADARVIAALSGRYHVVMDIPQSAYSQFDNSDKARIVLVPGAQTQTIYLNCEKKSLSDYRVRQALGWALDRKELISLGMEGLSEPVTTWLGSNPAYEKVKNAYYDSCNVEKSAQLLDDAGWMLGEDGFRYKDGQQLTILLRTFRNDQALGETIQMQWKKIGVNVSVQHGDYSLITTARETGDWDASIEGWGTFGNVSALLNAQYAADGAANYGRFKDEKLAGLLERLAQAATTEERIKIGEDISLYVAEQSPALYIAPRPQITAVSTSLEGFVPHFRQFENVVNANLRVK